MENIFKSSSLYKAAFEQCVVDPRIDGFEIRDDDIFLVGYPKSGTYWSQEMVWLIANDLDYEKAKISIMERCPYLQCSIYTDYKSISIEKNMSIPLFLTDSIRYASELKDPRFVKSHCPWDYLPKQLKNGSTNAKVIYIFRNPKDVCVSAYHYEKLISNHDFTFEEYCNFFLSKIQFYWQHVLSYWNRRTNRNLLVIRYEDMKNDLPSVIKQVSAFLKKPITNEQVDVLKDHLSFENMKNNKAVNQEEENLIKAKASVMRGKGKHMRSGVAGAYKEFMPEEIIRKFDESIEKNGKELFL